MTPANIQKLKLLDPKGKSGTIQSVVLRNDLHSQSYENTLYWLLKVTLLEKEALEKENKKYVRELKKHSLYTNELILQEE
ncbi:hypothetical protein [Sulfurovum sp.]|uniref:hypothetical protein n=1 Tax=Sulfurovum sp. TaxID=1969726 RepID=UPI00356896F7